MATYVLEVCSCRCPVVYLEVSGEPLLLDPDDMQMAMVPTKEQAQWIPQSQELTMFSL